MSLRPKKPGRPGVVFTPARLAERLARGLRAPAGAALLDPACGEGQLLLAGRLFAGQPAGLFGIELLSAAADRARERLARADPVPGPPVEIQCADALAPGTRWPAGTWVLANPPWASFSGRGSAREALGPPPPSDGAGRWPCLQSAFLERIARHVAGEGTGARVIVPAGLTETEAYGPLREAVTRRVRVVQVEDLGERAFPGVVIPAVILELAPADAPRASPRAWVGPAAAAGEPSPLASALEPFSRLPATTFADPGVHSGNAARELVVREAHEALPGVLEGRCLSAFSLSAPQAGLRLDLVPTPELRFRVRALSHYRAFPVLLRQTADRPIAALHEPRTYFRNSLLAAREVPGLDPAFLVAVLNGPVATAWHRESFGDARQRAFPQVKVGHLRTQPFPIVHRDQAPDLHDELARRVRALRHGSASFSAEVAILRQRALEAFGLQPELADAVTRSAAR